MRSTFFKPVCLYVLMMLVVPLLLGGCGGGGGGGDNGGGGTPTPTGTITGSVSGTTIMAVNQNGDIVATSDTAGRAPDLDNDNDGTPESFSFTLTGIPVGQEVRVYLVTGGITLALYFDSDGDGTPDTNVFRLNDVTDVNLGFVNTELQRQQGKAIPQFSPTENGLVSRGNENQVIPLAVTKPPTAGLSVSQLNEKGLHALSDGWITGPRTYFEAAYQKINSANTSSEDDTARFFFALSRVAALGFDTLADGNSSDMNRLGDILDHAGIPNDFTRASWQLFAKPFSKYSQPRSQLASGTPTGNELRDFLYRVAPSELQEAINILSEVPQSFKSFWTSPIHEDDEGNTTNDSGHKSFESDYGDVLFFRGLFKATLAGISIQRAYDLDADIDQAVNPNLDTDPANDTTIQAFLNQYTGFLSLSDTTTLAEAKSSLADALDDFSADLDVINAETDDQLNDLVTLDSLAVNNVATAKDYLAKTKQSILSGETKIVDYDQSKDPNKEDIVLNLQRFFDIGVDFRNPNRLPAFTGNKVSGLFPDKTFNGVVQSPDLNKDEDHDNIPDIVDDEVLQP